MDWKYEDFAVGFESTADGGYLVRAFHSGAEAEHAARLPFSPDSLIDYLALVMPRAHPLGLRDVASETEEPAPVLEAIGQQLFEALFPGSVRALYHSAWDAAEAAGHGLLIRLHLRPLNRHLAWLGRVPWELIFDARVGCFSCLSPRTPLVRHIEIPRSAERRPFRAPLRVLGIAAQPNSLSRLNLEEELRRVRHSNRIQVEMVDAGGLVSLRRALVRDRFQVLHFMGHGLLGFDSGSLVFADADGTPRRVTGQEVAHTLQGTEPPQLAVLNACHTAAAPRRSGSDPLAGVAAALVRGGLPAVLGMQFNVDDTAALTFSGVLYEHLAEGTCLEVALTEARLALYQADSKGMGWFCPVLFLRGADGRFAQEREEERSTRERGIERVIVEGETLQAEKIDVASVIDRGDASSHRESRAEESAKDREVRVKAKKVKAKSLSIAALIQERED